jgi:hypothetical protein
MQNTPERPVFAEIEHDPIWPIREDGLDCRADRPDVRDVDLSAELEDRHTRGACDQLQAGSMSTRVH